MRKNIKAFLMIIFLFALGNVSFGQPGNVHYGIMGIWGDAPLTDRGITMSGNVQSPISGTISFLFNTAAGNYNPKWCGSTSDYTRNVNQYISGGAYYYTSGGWDADLTCNVQSGYYYTLIVGKNAGSNNDLSILETSFNPVNISGVAQTPAANIMPLQDVNVLVTLSGAKNANEKVFVRYTNDNWATSNFIEITSFDGSFQGTAVIPGQTGGTSVFYYVFTTTQSTPDPASIDYFTLRLLNNSNQNFTYTVNVVNTINWCNLQYPTSGSINPGVSFDVFAQVYVPGITDQAGQGTGIQAWIGYSNTNTNPDTWTNWVPASYNTDFGNNDEYKADIGTGLPTGSYYYASRFQLNGGIYYYGGYNNGFWDGTNNISGTLSVTNTFSISGKTKYAGKANVGSPVPNPPTYNAMIYNIDNVIVILKSYPAGVELARDTSDLLGVYQFTGILDGSYTLSYDKYTVDTMQWCNGVDAIDISLIKYFIGSDTTMNPSRDFSKIYKKAANVDNNVSINSVDVSRLKAKIGAPYNVTKNFPKGNWVAYDTLITVSGANVNINLKTIGYGDYNASSTQYRDSTNGWSTPKSLPREIIVTSGESTVMSDKQYFEVPLSLSTNVKDLSALGLELKYPASDYRLVSAYLPGVKGSSVKINPTLDEIITNDNDLLVTDIDGVIRVVYATTNQFDAHANDNVIVLGFSPNKALQPGEVNFTLSGTGVVGDMYGEEIEDAYLVMPKLFVQGTVEGQGFDLAAYPNPFNDKVSLTYDIPEDGNVSIRVYDAIGNMVLTLVNEVQPQGRHTLDFSGINLPQGMYSFNLEFEGAQKSEHAVLKMIR